MTEEPIEIAAVRAALSPRREPLQLEDSTTVSAPGGRWRVTRPAFGGLVGPDDPTVLVVAPANSDDPAAPTWVADIPGRGLAPLADHENVAVFLAAHSTLPAETVARLIAINLGPRGPERVLLEDSEVASLLEERAGDVPPGKWRLDESTDEQGRHIGFLAALLQRSPADGLFRISVARWQVRVGGGELVIDRREILSDVLLQRYGG